MPNIWSVAFYLIPHSIKRSINPYETDPDVL